jgi:hypothetical protein
MSALFAPPHRREGFPHARSNGCPEESDDEDEYEDEEEEEEEEEEDA